MRGIKKNHMKGERQSPPVPPPWTDFATTRKNRPKGRFFENATLIYDEGLLF